MSWNPFKKAFSTKRTRQDDVELEREVHQLHHVQSVSKRLYKDMRRVTEAEYTCLRSQTRIGQEVRGGTGKVNPLRDIVEVMCRITDQLQVHVKDLRGRQDVLFSDPMKRFYNVYKHLDFHIKQREMKQQELDKQLAKMEKKKESTQTTASAKTELTQRKVASARSDYERAHQRLTHELPLLYEGRVDFFEPCVTATLQSELLYHRECSCTLQEAVVSQANGTPVVTSERTQQTNLLLESIRSLSIVSAL